MSLCGVVLGITFPPCATSTEISETLVSTVPSTSTIPSTSEIPVTSQIPSTTEEPPVTSDFSTPTEATTTSSIEVTTSDVNSSTPTPRNTGSSNVNGSGLSQSTIIVIVGVGCVVGLILICAVIFFATRSSKKSKKRLNSRPNNPVNGSGGGGVGYNYAPAVIPAKENSKPNAVKPFENESTLDPKTTVFNAPAVMQPYAYDHHLYGQQQPQAPFIGPDSGVYPQNNAYPNYPEPNQQYYQQNDPNYYPQDQYQANVQYYPQGNYAPNPYNGQQVYPYYPEGNYYDPSTTSNQLYNQDGNYHGQGVQNFSQSEAAQNYPAYAGSAQPFGSRGIVAGASTDAAVKDENNEVPKYDSGGYSGEDISAENEKELLRLKIAKESAEVKENENVVSREVSNASSQSRKLPDSLNSPAGKKLMI
ncbi:hypothetical protein HK099_000181 [Clydaea vesicula]|uniref:Uncharacterized protein n=1 Tax=Clydaea vesicula TaxID=447962 RepID=A0AAD5U4N6_9FUNG|nr:hypothetical protein HK099_000181 [Clydaea vesicula]